MYQKNLILSLITDGFIPSNRFTITSRLHSAISPIFHEFYILIDSLIVNCYNSVICIYT